MQALHTVRTVPVILLVGGAFLLGNVFAASAEIAASFHRVPGLDRLRDGGSTTWIRGADVSPHLRHAFIAIVDQDFATRETSVGWLFHRAVQQAHQLRQGASPRRTRSCRTSIPDVIAGTLVDSRERAATSGLDRTILALGIEVALSRDEQLEVLFNRVQLGAPAPGVDNAARHWFSKPASDLTLAEAAALAAFWSGPGRVQRSPLLLENRRGYVLNRMLDLGLITPSEHDEAIATPVLLVTH